MNHSDSEERVLRKILKALGSGEGGELETLSVPSGSGEDEIFKRLYVETLGLLPFENEPVEPSPEVKKRLMVSLGASVEPAVPDQGDPAVKSPTAIPAPGPAPGPAQGPVTFFDRRERGALEPPVPSLESSRTATRRSWWLRLAASLAFALMGLSVWLYTRTGEQTGMIADLAEKVQAMEAESERVASTQDDVVRSLRRMGVLEDLAVEVCRLRPIGRSPAQPGATGTLVLVKGRGPWSVSLHDLAPAPAGSVYQLWFLQDGVPMEKRVVPAADGGSVEMMSHEVPQAMNAAAVTLEASADVETPTGPMILYGAAGDMALL